MKLQTPQPDIALVVNFVKHHVLRPGYYHHERELIAEIERRQSDSNLLPLLRHVDNWGHHAARERTLADHEKAVMAATRRLLQLLCDSDSPAMRSERTQLVTWLR